MFNLGRKEKRKFTRTAYLPIRQEVSVLRVKILRPPCKVQAACVQWGCQRGGQGLPEARPGQCSASCFLLPAGLFWDCQEGPPVASVHGWQFCLQEPKNARDAFLPGVDQAPSQRPQFPFWNISYYHPGPLCFVTFGFKRMTPRAESDCPWMVSWDPA